MGDPVYVAMDADLKTWQQIPIRFSSGTGGDSNSSMIQVRFGDPDSPESVISTRNQLFLLPGKKLKRASTLVPGQDHLVRPDGSTVPVLDLVSGKFSKGVHMISTSNATTTDMAGHLIIANGVICGDYSLQLTHLEEAKPSLMAGGREELPEFGTKEYGLRYKHLFADAFKAHVATTKLDVAAEHAESGPEGFTPYALVRSLSIPENATFLTLERWNQAATSRPTRRARPSTRARARISPLPVPSSSRASIPPSTSTWTTPLNCPRRTSPPPSWTWPPNTRKAVRRVSRPTRWSARCRSPRTPPPS